MAAKYSGGLRHAIFSMAEYIGMMGMAAIATICFLDDRNGPLATIQLTTFSKAFTG